MQRATWTDERLDDLAVGIDKRFDQVDRRFEQVDKRFEQVDKRFEQVDQRFEQVDRRFEQVDRRLDRIDDGIRHLSTTIILVGGALLAALLGAIATGSFGAS
jgi:DNA anti-recombination protein RmuC